MPQPGNSTTAWRWRWCRECPGDSAEEGLGSVTVTSPSAQPPSCLEHSVGLHRRETTNAPRFMFLTGAPVLSWWQTQSWQRVGLRCVVPGSAALSATQALLRISGAGHGRGWGHNSRRCSQWGPAHRDCLAGSPWPCLHAFRAPATFLESSRWYYPQLQTIMSA